MNPTGRPAIREFGDERPYTASMTPAQAVEALRDRPTVAVAKSSILQIKELHVRCLDHGVPAAMRRPCGPGGG